MLRKNKARVALTVFGITIGIAMVVIVLSAGQGVKGLVMEQISTFGDDWIDIEVKIPATKHMSQENANALAGGVTITTLTHEDAQEIAKLENIKNFYSGITAQAIVAYKTETKRPNIFAVTPGYFDIDKGKIFSGRVYTEEEERGADQVVVLGWKIYKDLFGTEDAIGKTVKIDKKTYRVIGVMKERGVTGFFNFDELAYVPLQTAQKKILGIEHVLWIIAQVEDNRDATFTAEEIKALLRQRHDIHDPDKEDFAVVTMQESIEIVNTIFTGITWLLIALAAISLLVGGIGIMNVMYVSVVERTFEIGLRKAVGATNRAILWQFLIEAIVVTAAGGCVGILIGAAISLAVALVAQYLGYHWEFTISLFSFILALGFSTAVGLLFGIYPAKRAASLDPVEALRQE